MFAWVRLALIRTLTTWVERTTCVLVARFTAACECPFLVDAFSIFWMTVIVCFNGAFIHVLDASCKCPCFKLELASTRCVLVENSFNLDSKLYNNLAQCFYLAYLTFKAVYCLFQPSVSSVSRFKKITKSTSIVSLYLSDSRSPTTNEPTNSFPSSLRRTSSISSS